jgi:hypothetical protein
MLLSSPATPIHTIPTEQLPMNSPATLSDPPDPARARAKHLIPRDLSGTSRLLTLDVYADVFHEKRAPCIVERLRLILILRSQGPPLSMYVPRTERQKLVPIHMSVSGPNLVGDSTPPGSSSRSSNTTACRADTASTIGPRMFGALPLPSPTRTHTQTLQLLDHEPEPTISALTPSAWLSVTRPAIGSTMLSIFLDASMPVDEGRATPVTATSGTAGIRGVRPRPR